LPLFSPCDKGFSLLIYFFWGPRPARLCLAGRRYAPPLAGLLGPAALAAPWSGLTATAAQRWAAHLLY